MSQNQHAQKASETWYPKESKKNERKELATIIQTHAIEPSIKERDEMIERLKARLEITDNHLLKIVGVTTAHRENKQAIVATEKLLKGEK